MLAWSDEAVFQTKAEEKLSVIAILPMPGFCSGVGTLVGKTSGVGVAEGGNQTIVGEGTGVGVPGGGVRIEVSSKPAQPVAPMVKAIMRINVNEKE